MNNTVDNQENSPLADLVEWMVRRQTSADVVRRTIEAFEAYKQSLVVEDDATTKRRDRDREYSREYRRKHAKKPAVDESKNPPPHTPSPEEIDVCVGVPKRAPLISPEAYQLADECFRLVGVDPAHPPLTLYGLPAQAQIWIARGYDPAVVLAVFAQHGREKPLSYIDKAVNTKQRQASAPEAELPLMRTVNGGNNARPHERSLKSVIRELGEQADRLEEGALSAVRESSARVVSKR